jgi:hypothetical protein
MAGDAHQHAKIRPVIMVVVVPGVQRLSDCRQLLEITQPERQIVATANH